MYYRLILMIGLVVLLSLGWSANLFAHTQEEFTPTKILALKGKVFKKRVKFPVKLSNGEKFRMAGFFYFQVEHVHGCLHLKERKWVGFCLFHVNAGQKPVQTVLHGLTYNHRYWDVKRINDRKYSYARFMAKNGFVVLALDLLGSGRSDVPDGDVLNISESSFTIAQVLSSLKSGKNPIHRSFRKVVVTGHSLGSILSVFTLGTFPNIADALVVTGWAWAPHVVLPPDLVEAALQNPYVQLPPILREQLFYFLRKADLAVIAFDNRVLADQTPRGIFTQGLPLLEAMALGNDLEFIKNFSRSNQVRVPVLVQLGEFDVIAPASLADQEADFYPNASRVKVQTLTNIGHSFNLHVNNQKSWKRVKRWLNRVLD